MSGVPSYDRLSRTTTGSAPADECRGPREVRDRDGARALSGVPRRRPSVLLRRRDRAPVLPDQRRAGERACRGWRDLLRGRHDRRLGLGHVPPRAVRQERPRADVQGRQRGGDRQGRSRDARRQTRVRRLAEAIAGTSPDVSEHSPEDQTKSTDATSGADGAQPDPPAANRGRAEPIATAPDESGQGSSGGTAEASTGSSSRVPGEQGEPPRSMETDDAAGAADTARAASMPATATGGVPTPGDSHGVAVPAVQAAAGTSEQSEQVDGVKVTSLAPPGKPDGEVDTRA